MKNLNIDGLRLLLGLGVTQGLNVLTLMEVVNLDIDQLAAINAFVGTMIAIGFYVIKPEAQP